MDAGVSLIDVETRKIKEEMKLKEAQARAIAEHGELALITVDGPQSVTQERISLRPPMLQVNKSFVFSPFDVGCLLFIGVDGKLIIYFSSSCLEGFCTLFWEKPLDLL